MIEFKEKLLIRNIRTGTIWYIVRTYTDDSFRQIIIGNSVLGERSLTPSNNFTNNWIQIGDKFRPHNNSQLGTVKAVRFIEGKPCLLYTSPSPRDRG